ncbi:MAG: TadE/TadG family type IV pilus assembly protein [Robiginitomaculum sp.]
MLKQLLNTDSLQKFIKNKDGVVAIEFAFIMPVLLLLYVGVIELSLLISKDRAVSHAAFIAVNLAAQAPTPDTKTVGKLDKKTIENIFSATLATMNAKTADSSSISIDISSYVRVTNGVHNYGYASLGSKFTTPAPHKNISDELLNHHSGIIIVRVEQVYHSFGHDYVNNNISKKRITDFTLSQTFVQNSRNSRYIKINGGKNLTCSFVMGTNGMPDVTCN